MTLQKAFFNEQCKEIEGNNRKFRSRDVFKKTGNMKVPFCSKMGKIKDRNGKDLIEAGEIKRWKDYIEEPYQKDLCDPMCCSMPGLPVLHHLPDFAHIHV